MLYISQWKSCKFLTKVFPHLLIQKNETVGAEYGEGTIFGMTDIIYERKRLETYIAVAEVSGTHIAFTLQYSFKLALLPIPPLQCQSSTDTTSWTCLQSTMTSTKRSAVRQKSTTKCYKTSLRGGKRLKKINEKVLRD